MALQQEIIQALGAKPQIDAQQEIRRSVDFLKTYLKTYPIIKSLLLANENNLGTLQHSGLAEPPMCQESVQNKA